VAYVPAGKLVAVALAANPKLSDRAIAAKAGVSDSTVLRARRLTASSEAVEKRIGRDGKARRLPVSAAQRASCVAGLFGRR
jgi:hypothetical protein